MFLGADLRTVTKTGSLGLRHLVQDCGVITLANSETPLATFGYCAQGFRLPTTVVDTLMGLVGLEIARLLDLPSQPNADWTPEGEAMLLRSS